MPENRDITAQNEEPRAGLDVFGTTHAGKVRTQNDDQFFIATLHKSMRVQQTSLDDLSAFTRLQEASAYLLVVADGASGMVGARQASTTAVETIAQHIGEIIGCYYNFDVDMEQEFLDQLQNAVERAHQQVRKLDPSFGQGPATTLTMVALLWPRAYVVHVGDSRAYYLRGGRLRQLTRDQTAYEELLDDGSMSEQQAGEYAGLTNRLKNVLTSALGGQIKPSIGLVDLQAGDVLLLCTDGLTGHVSDSDLASVLGAGASAEESCRRLVDLTLERGARDNVAVIVGRCAAP
jgi:serine/threonine protein phosphatase PrpC